MDALNQHYRIANPFDTSQVQGITNKWPYYNVYAAGTMSEIAKMYAAYEARFQGPVPGRRVEPPGYPVA